METSPPNRGRTPPPQPAAADEQKEKDKAKASVMGREQPEQRGGRGQQQRWLASDTTRRLFSSMFFGWQGEQDQAGGDGDAAPGSAVQGSTNEEVSEGRTPNGATTSSSSSNNNLQSAIASQVGRLIPEDPAELRETALYRNAYRLIQWQRDNYLVGPDYADWRKKERTRLSDQTRDVRCSPVCMPKWLVRSTI